VSVTCAFWWFINGIDAHNGAVTAIATVLIGVFTVALVCVSRRQWQTLKRQADIFERQATLSQAQFDQWVDLTDWRCSGQPQNNKLQILVDLVNPSEFPMTLNGTLTIGEGEQRFDELFLSPHSPKTMEFHVGVANAEWSVSLPVRARLIHQHKISKEPNTQELRGELVCQKWKIDGKWHATFRQLVDMDPAS
jgi:hypothetical protein